MSNITLTRFRGDTFELPITVQNPDGSPVDLSGASVRFTLGSITHATAGVTVTIDGPAGSIIINIPYTVMDTLTARNCLFDVEVTYASGKRETLFVLTVSFTEDVTK